MMVMPSGIIGQFLLTDGTYPILFTPQVVKLACSVQRVFHVTGKPFLKVEFPGRVIRVGLRLDLDVTFDRDAAGVKQTPFFTVMVAEEYPVARSHRFKVLMPDPVLTFMG